MVYVRTKHIRVDWEPGKFIPFDDLRDFMLNSYGDELKKELKDATPPPRFDSHKGQLLKDSWFIYKPSQFKVPASKDEIQIYNTKEVYYQGKSWNLLKILHNGSNNRGKGFCAKGLRKGMIGPKLMVFRSYGRVWRVPCVRGVNPFKIERYGGAGFYNIRKDITNAFYRGDKIAARRIKEWQPRSTR